ncbi:MAG: lytic transglycosylase domain-containing protein [Oligoflexales bacterium]|nr:lytic transglycosylase domain-containing protein [Oligoflexales bacterium]
MKKWAIIILATLFFYPILSYGVVLSPVLPMARDQNEIAEFPIPAKTMKKVRFWEKVFSRYPSTSSIIHDEDDPSLILDVVDFNLIAKKKRKNVPSYKDREKYTLQYLKRYELAGTRFHKLKLGALRYGAIEQRMYHIYRRSNLSLENLLHGRIKLKSKLGLAEQFLVAAKRAQNYIPYMEEIFRELGLPAKITRLPFVESMFTQGALSKAGAAGIWQIMPETGKKFLSINEWVDERYSPLKATRAAAMVLKENYAELGSWALAITAYNHGKNGMLNAMRRLKTRDFDEISTNYESPSFQYASKNFYPAFLAAASVYKRLIDEKIVEKKEKMLKIRPVLVGDKSLQQILQFFPSQQNIIEDFNPCLKKRTLRSYQSIKLPPSYKLFLPLTLADQLEKKLSYARK